MSNVAKAMHGSKLHAFNKVKYYQRLIAHTFRSKRVPLKTRSTASDQGLLASVLMMLAAVLLVFPAHVACSQMQPASPSGDWIGTLNVPGQDLHLALHVTAAADGKLQAKLDSVDQRTLGIRCSNVSFSAGVLSFRVPSISGNYEGKLGEDGTNIVGTWAQRAGSIPLSWTRDDHTLPAHDPSFSQQPTQSASLAGNWKGALDIAGQHLRLVLHLSSKPNGKLEGRLDSIDQGVMGIPCSQASFTGNTLLLVIPSIHGSYRGHVEKEDSAITGTWTQGAASIPLVWTRDVPHVLDRPQEPTLFPYVREEVEVENTGANVRLAGTLTKPEGRGPFPAVLLITGSGPQDRDETVFGHKPFLVLSDYLTNHGIAVLRLDDRGTAQSTGDFNAATTQDFAGDARAAVHYLMARPDVQRAHVGLVGHSEGGIVAAMVAAEDHDIAYVVLMAGLGVPVDVLLPQQVYRGALAEGRTEAEAEKAALTEAAVLHTLKTEPDLRKAISDAETTLGANVDKARLDAQVAMFSSPWFRFVMNYDPYSTLKKITCPVLALNGSKDFQVPAELNLPFIRSAVASNPGSQVIELQGLNHLFQNAKTGAASEYAQITETISPSVLAQIADWIQAYGQARTLSGLPTQ